MTEVSNSPHAWLLPSWAEVKRQTAFERLAPELQAEALAKVLEADYPAKALEIREWNRATRIAMIAVLDMAHDARPAQREVELWRAVKDGRELRCVAVYMPNGIDLRLLENGELHGTELFSDGLLLQARAREWRVVVASRGWRVPVVAGKSEEMTGR